MLNMLTSILHDLWFDWPKDGFKIEDGRLCITLYDQENFLDPERTVTFRLCIYAVQKVQIEGDPQDLPCQEEFSSFSWDKWDKVLSIKNCLRTTIKCKVKELYVELDQLATHGPLARYVRRG
jgi:hypothetical protein